MGQSIVKHVIQLLDKGGIPANQAQPARKMVNVLIPVAAVSIQQIDQARQETTVRVEIVGMAANGGYPCENTAMKAYEILRNAGAVCQLQRCTFQSKTGVFSMPLLATFTGEAYQKDWKPLETGAHTFSVTAGAAALPYVTHFSATQAVTDADTEDLEDMPWKFTLEEWIPAGETEPDGPTALFEMTVTTDTVREHFEGCSLVSLERKMEASGIRQVRKGVALLRTVQQLA